MILTPNVEPSLLPLLPKISTQENLRNRMRVKVITNREKAIKRVAKPSHKRSQHMHEDLVIIQTTIETLELNKPIYVGCSVLDLSKLLMYRFHYEKMYSRYDDIKLCFTDTDSLLYEITYPLTTLDEDRHKQSIYLDMAEQANDHDFSKYPSDHPLFNTTNKKAIGKFKDELNSLSMEEFAGVLPKCYSILYLGKVKDNHIQNLDPAAKQTANGTKEGVKKQYLKHVQYIEVLINLSTLVVKQNVIRSKAHTISTYHKKRTA